MQVYFIVAVLWTLSLAAKRAFFNLKTRTPVKGTPETLLEQSELCVKCSVFHSFFLA